MRKKLAFALIAVFFFTPGVSGVCFAFETTWSGQFRINSYYQNADNDSKFGKANDIAASRLRFRPTLDLSFDDRIKTHVQLNIGHINSNVTNARNEQGGNPAVALRHAYISAPLPKAEDLTLVAGIVPISDRFGDALFSSDWDYNPLTYALMGKVLGLDVRLAHGNLSEGGEGAHPADDMDQIFLDVDSSAGAGASFYSLNDNTKPTSAITGASRTREDYAGVRFKRAFDAVEINAFALYNTGKRTFGAAAGAETERKNSGVALKAEAKARIGALKAGVMALYASGDKNFSDSTKGKSRSFITPASIAGTTGYWGYTGKLNIQGPTDTGMDTHYLNIDGGGASTANLGLGLTTVQANVSFPVVEKEIDGYAALGWYTHNSAAAGFKKYIGTDFYAQGTYHFGSGLNWDIGADYAMLGKGHAGSAALGQSNQSTRNVAAVFSRLQLEF